MGENMRKSREETIKILNILGSLYPNRTALKFNTPFELLVATILSAQCTDKKVNEVTEKLFKKYNTPEQFAELKQEELEKDVKECGFYKNKSRNIIEASRKIVKDFNGKIPMTREELMTLPGVGRKTANVILSNAFGIQTIAVDTHVFRVANRIGLAEAKDELTTEFQLMENIPEYLWKDAHNWLIYHGRNICKARNPKCMDCPVRKFCNFFNMNRKS